MRNLYLLFLIYVCTLSGCVSEYGNLLKMTIVNNSSSNIFVYLTCTDSIKEDVSRFYIFQIKQSVHDGKGNKKNDTLFDRDKIFSKCSKEVIIGEHASSPNIICDSQKVYVFFIEDYIIKNNNKTEVFKKQLYSKKYIYTQEELEKLKWKIIYN